MKIILTPEEAKNVQLAILSLSKQPNTGRTEMVYLMNLMTKFDEAEEAEKPKK